MLKLPPLFKTKKEFSVITFVLVAIIALRLFFIYQDYTNLKKLNNYYYTKAQVLKVYQNKNSSTLIKLKTKDNLKLYLYSKKSPPKELDWLNIKIKPKEGLSFIDYIRGFYVNGEIVDKVAQGFDRKSLLNSKISKQHKNSNLANFYNAIFLAEPLNRNLRDAISNLGVSHLVALSGFHLGIIWTVVFALLYLPYRALHKSFFPWRNINIDIGFVSIVILAIFVLYVGAPTTLVRAYAMLLITWVLLILGLELVSFEFLIFATLLILAFIPKLIVDVGFWLSVCGVFYIFLILKWLKDYPKWLLTLFIIPIGVFILMFPIAHYIFGTTNIWQLSSPLLSVLFIIFYPVIALLHLFNLGGLFDKEIFWLLSLPKESIEINIPIGLVGAYTLSSILAVFNRKIFYFTLAFALFITVWCLFFIK